MRVSVAAVVGLIGMVGTPVGAVARAAAMVVSSAPRQSGLTASTGWTSSNWSGYAITGSGYRAVTGAWTVPPAGATSSPTFSSSWIGIDGFANSHLIQTGTESDYYGGSAHYDAWWEILPASETVIPAIPVHPGDHMSASIVRGTNGKWTITISDVTDAKSFSIVKSYSGPRTSAEWILEATDVGGTIAHLTHYGNATFDPGTVNGANPHLTAADSGAMHQGGHTVSTPSRPDRDTDGFTMRYGATAPPPPSRVLKNPV